MPTLETLGNPLGRLIPAMSSLIMLALLVSCGGGSGGNGGNGGGPTEPGSLTVTPLSGPPGAVLTVSGLDFSAEEPFEVWVGAEQAPARLNEDGTLAAAIPLFLGDDGWPAAPAEPQIVEVRRGSTVLGRSDVGVTVNDLPRAPGSTQQVQAALADITSAYEALFSLMLVASEDQVPIREGVIAMLRGLISEGEASLQAMLEGTSPFLEGAEVDTELIDALLASSGALAYFEAYAEALRGVERQAFRSLASLYCRGEGEEYDLACQMQIFVVLDDYSRAFVNPTAKTYANTVGLVAGLLAMGTVTVPAAAIVGAILSVADFVMEKVAPALFPSRLTQFKLKMPKTTIEIGETTESEIVVEAANTPPQITYLDIFEQIKTLAGLKNIDFSDKFNEVLKATAEFALDLYLKLVKTYVASHPDAHPWATAGDIRIPAMGWGPVDVKSSDLVTLFSFDETVVQSLEEDLEWQGLKLGEATVRVMPRGPGERSKVLRDHALCLGCVYSGGAFGNEMPDSSVTVIVGEIQVTATPHQGVAPLQVTFSWTGVEPQDEPLTCILDVGDGSAFYTVHDCANTASQVHTYPHTSALTESGVYKAELKIVGTQKTARTEVLAEWTFMATPNQGEAPLDVTFNWSGFDPAGGSFSCRLEPGDGSAVKTIDDCLGTNTATHRYAARGGFTATLIVTGALRQDLKSVPVTVTDVMGCEGIGDLSEVLSAPAWIGRVTYDFDQTASQGDRTARVQRSGDYTVRLDYRVEHIRDGRLWLVRWRGLTGTVTGGTSSMSDSSALGAYPPATWTGSGTPELVTVLFEIDVDACTYSLSARNSVQATHSTGIVGTHGSHVEVIDHSLASGSTFLGNMSVPSVYHWPVEGHDHFLFGGGYGIVLADLADDQFNSAQISWELTPVEP
jgi:PKD repeat protein